MREISLFFEELSGKLETRSWEDAYLTVYGIGEVEKNLGRFDLNVSTATAWLADNETPHRDRLLLSLEERDGGLDEIDADAVAAVLEVAQLYAERETAGWGRVRIRVRACGGEDVYGRTLTLTTAALTPREPLPELRAVVNRPPGEQQPERAAELILSGAARWMDLVVRERESDGDNVRANFNAALEAKQSIIDDQRRTMAELRRDLERAHKRQMELEDSFRKREDGHVDKVLDRRSDEAQAEAEAIMAKTLGEGFQRTLEKGTALGSLYLLKDIDVSRLPVVQKLMANPALLDAITSPAVMKLLNNAVVVDTLSQPHILRLLNSPGFQALCSEEKIPALLAVIESMAAEKSPSME